MDINKIFISRIKQINSRASNKTICLLCSPLCDIVYLCVLVEEDEVEGTSNPASRKQACLMGFLSSHHWIANPHPGMDYERVNILRLDTIFKDAIQSLMSGANSYVQCVVTVPHNLGGLLKLQKVRTYSRPSIALSFVAGSLLVKGKKAICIYKNPCRRHISAANSLQVHFSKKAPFNFDYFFLFLTHLSKD